MTIDGKKVQVRVYKASFKYRAEVSPDIVNLTVGKWQSTLISNNNDNKFEIHKEDINKDIKKLMEGKANIKMKCGKVIKTLDDFVVWHNNIINSELFTNELAKMHQRQAKCNRSINRLIKTIPVGDRVAKVKRKEKKKKARLIKEKQEAELELKSFKDDMVDVPM